MIKEVVACFLLAVACAEAVGDNTIPELESTRIIPLQEIKNVSLTIDLNKDLSANTTHGLTVEMYRNGLASYEKRIKGFIENMRNEYFSLNTNSSRFLKELDVYLKQLPKQNGNTQVVTKRYRPTCYCDGVVISPCPDRCMYSCYGGNHSFSAIHFANCSGKSYPYCYCYSGSLTTCQFGKISNCYDENPQTVPDTCVNSTINQSAIRESFNRFSDLLIEPLKILVRGLEFKLNSFKQAVFAADMIANVSTQFCDVDDKNCYSEQTQVLSKSLNNFWQMKGNITLHMIKTYKKAESVVKDVDDLKEQIVQQVNEAIKNHTCCLKGLDFTVKGNDCNPKPIELPTMTVALRNSRIQPQTVQVVNARKTCTYPSFECDNQRCVSDSYRCDGTDDCGDKSDEADC